MKLEDKFFKSFFYPFLVGVFLSTLIVTIFLGLFTNNNYDKRTQENVINLEKNKSKINIRSINNLLNAFFFKVSSWFN